MVIILVLLISCFGFKLRDAKTTPKKVKPTQVIIKEGDFSKDDFDIKIALIISQASYCQTKAISYCQLADIPGHECGLGLHCDLQKGNMSCIDLPWVEKTTLTALEIAKRLGCTETYQL